MTKLASRPFRATALVSPRRKTPGDVWPRRALRIGPWYAKTRGRTPLACAAPRETLDPPRARSSALDRNRRSDGRIVRRVLRVADLHVHLHRLGRKVGKREVVHVDVSVGGAITALRPSVMFHLLFVLARQREVHASSGARSSEQGWIWLPALFDELEADRPTINTYVHRLRERFWELSLVDADQIVERRMDSDEMRIGCRSVTIRSE